MVPPSDKLTDNRADCLTEDQVQAFQDTGIASIAETINFPSIVDLKIKGGFRAVRQEWRRYD